MRLLSANVMLLLLLLSATCRGAPEHKPQASSLVLGQPVQRKLGRNENHTYLIHLTSSQYTRVRLAPQSVDVNVTLQDKTGREITTLNCRESEPAILSLLSESEADYWLELRALDNGVGSYELTAEESRLATVHERRLVFGERAFLAGELLRVAAQAESSRQALAKYDEAQAHWRGAKGSRH
jgi:hypothetical protein